MGSLRAGDRVIIGIMAIGGMGDDGTYRLIATNELSRPTLYAYVPESGEIRYVGSVLPSGTELSGVTYSVQQATGQFASLNTSPDAWTSWQVDTDFRFSKVGNTFDPGISFGFAGVAQMTPMLLAQIDVTSDTLRAVAWDGTDFSFTGNDFVLPNNIGGCDITAINGSSDSIVLWENFNRYLQAYQFDGTDWSTLGNPSVQTGGNGTNIALAYIGNGHYVSLTNDGTSAYMEAWSFDGTDWAKLASKAVGRIVSPSCTGLGDGVFMTADTEQDMMAVYRFDGTVFSQLDGYAPVTNSGPFVTYIGDYAPPEESIFQDRRNSLDSYPVLWGFNKGKVTPAAISGSTTNQITKREVSTGKIYFEFQNIELPTTPTSLYFGAKSSAESLTYSLISGQATGENTTSIEAITGQTFTEYTSVVQVAVDVDTGQMWWGLDGVWNNTPDDPSAGTGERRTTTYPSIGAAFSCAPNLGGYWTLVLDEEDFAYAPPTGFGAIPEDATPPDAAPLNVFAGTEQLSYSENTVNKFVGNVQFRRARTEKAITNDGNKYYMEFYVGTPIIASQDDISMGLCSPYSYLEDPLSSGDALGPGSTIDDIELATGQAYDQYSSVFMVAFDFNTGQRWVGLDGVWSGDPAAGTGEIATDVTGSEYNACLCLGYAGTEGRIYTAASQQTYAAPTGFSPFDTGTDFVDTTFPVERLAFMGKRISVNDQDSNMRDLDFNTSGTVMFTVGGTSDDIFHYDLATAWDPFSAEHDALKNYSLSFDPRSLFIGNGGTDFYCAAQSPSAQVHQLTFPSPYDITGTPTLQSFALPGNPYSATLSHDGAYMFVLDTSYLLTRYALGTPWDVTTAVADGSTLSLLDFDATIDARAVTFIDNGSTMIVTISADNSFVWKYHLSTPYDLSTAQKVIPSQEIREQAGFGASIVVAPDGDKAFYIGDNDAVYRLEVL